MAEPIRRIAPPVHRRPQSVRPHPRPRPIPWVVDESEGAPDKTPVAPTSRPTATAPERPEEHEALPLRAFQPFPDKNLRSLLLTALGIHLAALLLSLLVSTSPAPGLSDTLLASAVLVAGVAVLALAGSGRRG